MEASQIKSSIESAISALRDANFRLLDITGADDGSTLSYSDFFKICATRSALSDEIKFLKSVLSKL